MFFRFSSRVVCICSVCRVAKLLSLLLNIFFISSTFLSLRRRPDEPLNASKWAVSIVEISGILIGFLFIFARMVRKDWIGIIDMLRLLSSWSAFKLIYQFRVQVCAFLSFCSSKKFRGDDGFRVSSTNSEMSIE